VYGSVDVVELKHLPKLRTKFISGSGMSGIPQKIKDEVLLEGTGVRMLTRVARSSVRLMLNTTPVSLRVFLFRK